MSLIDFSKSYSLARQKDFDNDVKFRLPDQSINATLNDLDFSGFVEEAYRSPNGYAIRWNPRTKRKEIIVAGTRTGMDWLANLLDVHKHSRWYGAAVKKYADIADKEGVKVAYGHSRGGALVADMPWRGEKVGLNAAMVMAKNKRMRNYRGTSLFDKAIGFTGKRTYVRKSKFHKVWKK